MSWLGMRTLYLILGCFSRLFLACFHSALNGEGQFGSFAAVQEPSGGTRLRAMLGGLLAAPMLAIALSAAQLSASER